MLTKDLATKVQTRRISQRLEKQRRSRPHSYSKFSPAKAKPTSRIKSVSRSKSLTGNKCYSHINQLNAHRQQKLEYLRSVFRRLCDNERATTTYKKNNSSCSSKSQKPISNFKEKVSTHTSGRFQSRESNSLYPDSDINIYTSDDENLRLTNGFTEEVVVPTRSFLENGAKRGQEDDKRVAAMISKYIKRKSYRPKNSRIGMFRTYIANNHNNVIEDLLNSAYDSDSDIESAKITQPGVSFLDIDETESDSDKRYKGYGNYNTNSGFQDSYEKYISEMGIDQQSLPSTVSSDKESPESMGSDSSRNEHHVSSQRIRRGGQESNHKHRNMNRDDYYTENRGKHDDKYTKKSKPRDARNTNIDFEFAPNEKAIDLDVAPKKLESKSKDRFRLSRHDYQTRGGDNFKNETKRPIGHRQYSNNSSYKNPDQETSSRRHRSLSDKKVAFGRTTSIGHRGIKTRSSSSDEASSKRYRYHIQTYHDKGRNYNKSPGDDVSSLIKAQSTGSMRQVNQGSPRARSPAPSKKPSGGKIGKSGKGKGGSKGKDVKGSASTTEGIIPLAPEEICERCQKYRMDQDIGDCVPLDFSHVQQLEKIAENQTDEGIQKLLRTVITIIEEKVCKQNFGHLLPCGCPGCKYKPTVCQSIEKFFSSESKGDETGQDGKSKGGGKGKGKKGKNKKENKDDDAGMSFPCCRGPSTCYYDRGGCYDRSGCYANRWCPPPPPAPWNNYCPSYNSSSALRMSCWPERRMFTPYDRCWSNRSSEQSPSNSTLPYKNHIVYRDAINETHRCGPDNAKADKLYSSEVGNAITEDSLRERSKERQSNPKTMARFHSKSDAITSEGILNLTRATATTSTSEFRRFGKDLCTPCPHDTAVVPPIGKNIDRYRRHVTSNYYNSNVWERYKPQSITTSTYPKATWEPPMPSPVDDHATTSQQKDSSSEEKSKHCMPDETNLNQEEECVKDVKSKDRRSKSSPRKRKSKKSPRSKQTSPTTAVIGELEARTKELLAEAKHSTKFSDDFMSSKSRSPDNSKFVLGFSPIKPPDINMAYSVDYQTDIVGDAVTDFSQNKKVNDDRQWWDDVPKNTEATNPFVFKQYDSSSAMPINVKPITSNTAPGKIPPDNTIRKHSETKPRPVTAGGRSHSEPRLPQSSTSKKGSRTPRSDKTIDYIKTDHKGMKTGSSSFIVYKGRPGKGTEKEKKSVKRMWKY